MNAYMHPETSRALLAESRYQTARLRTERDLRAALVVETDDAMKNLLTRREFVADERRFAVEPVLLTGWGAL